MIRFWTAVNGEKINGIEFGGLKVLELLVF